MTGKFFSRLLKTAMVRGESARLLSSRVPSMSVQIALMFMVSIKRRSGWEDASAAFLGFLETGQTASRQKCLDEGFNIAYMAAFSQSETTAGSALRTDPAAVTVFT